MKNLNKYSFFLLFLGLLLPHFTSSLTPYTCVPQTPNTCPLPTGDFNLLFTVADLNGDGKDDVIVRPDASTSSDPDNTQILLSNGKTNWRRYLWDALNGENTILTVVDFNGDGKEDILRREMTPASGKNTAEVWFYQGSGEFTVVAVPNGDALRADSTNIFTGDFDGDGQTDFIRQETTNTANIYLSLGTGTFTVVDIPENSDPRSLLPGDKTNLIVGDFNGDGFDDFLRQKKDSNDDPSVPTAVLFISKGDGTFTLKDLPESLNIGGGVSNLVVGDFNGDCVDDFIRQSICEPISQIQASWTNWISFTAQTVAGTMGTAVGTLMVNGVSVDVTFSGSVHQNSRTNDQADFDFVTYPQTYPHGPTTGDEIALTGFPSDFTEENGAAQKITFSQPITNPRLALWSLGNINFPVQYDFGTIPVTIIKTGPNSYTNNQVTLTIPSGNIVQGQEGSGIIELTGTFTEINFKVNVYEYWHAFTVGIAPTVIIPCSDPSTLNLGSATGDFTATDLPASYNIEGAYSKLFVGDFNCDGIDDFIKQENGDRPGSTEAAITTFLSNMIPTSGASPLFTKKAQEQVFEDTSALFPGANERSPIYLGDFNGDGRDDYIQYFGDSCFTVIHALSSGKCVNKANQCKTTCN